MHLITLFRRYTFEYQRYTTMPRSSLQPHMTCHQSHNKHLWGHREHLLMQGNGNNLNDCGLMLYKTTLILSRMANRNDMMTSFGDWNGDGCNKKWGKPKTRTGNFTTEGATWKTDVWSWKALPQCVGSAGRCEPLFCAKANEVSENTPSHPPRPPVSNFTQYYYHSFYGNSDT